MRIRPTRVGVSACATAAILTLLLSACAGGTPATQPAAQSDSTTEPGATGYPNPTLTPVDETGGSTEPGEDAVAVSVDEHEPIAAPQPLFGMSCAELVPASAMSALTGPGVRPASPDLQAWSALDVGIPVQYAMRQLQGYSCLWENDEPPKFETESLLLDNPEYVELKLNVIPHAMKDYAKANSMFGPFPVAKPWLCNTDTTRDYRACRWAGLASGKYWVEVSMQGLKHQGTNKATIAQFMALKDGLIGRLESATLVKPWAVPSDVRTISDACPGLITAEVVAEAFESQPSAVRFQDGGNDDPYIEAVGPKLAKSDPCYFSVPGQERSYGPSVAILAAGEWAWNEARAAGKGTYATIAPLALTGLADGNSAWIRSTKWGSSVDLLIDGNWISLHINDDMVAPLALSTRTAITTLAQGVADLVRN